jgi:hypothetical protein
MDNVLTKVISEVSTSMVLSFFKVNSNARTALSTATKQTGSVRDTKNVRGEYIKLLNKGREFLKTMSKNKIAALIIENQNLLFSPKKVIGILEKYHKEKGTPPPWK